MWGEYAQGAVTVCCLISALSIECMYLTHDLQITLPELEQFPVFAPVHIVINVVTMSEPVCREDTPKNGPIFPAPPLGPSAIDLKFMREVVVAAEPWTVDGVETVGILGGFGSLGSELRAITDVKEIAWIAEAGIYEESDEKKQKGRYKQEVTFTSTFEMTCPPTLESLLSQIT